MTRHLEGFPVVVEIPVAWADMDARAHVNNAVYFRYFETARIRYFEAAGILSEGFASVGRGRILASTNCRFRVALTYPDSISVGARVAAIGCDRFLMHYRVVSRRLDQVAAEGEGVVVVFDYDAGRKAEVDVEERRAIAALEGNEPPALRPDGGAVPDVSTWNTHAV